MHLWVWLWLYILDSILLVLRSGRTVDFVPIRPGKGFAAKAAETGSDHETKEVVPNAIAAATYSMLASGVAFVTHDGVGYLD